MQTLQKYRNFSKAVSWPYTVQKSSDHPVSGKDELPSSSGWSDFWSIDCMHGIYIYNTYMYSIYIILYYIIIYIHMILYVHVWFQLRHNFIGVCIAMEA